MRYPDVFYVFMRQRISLLFTVLHGMQTRSSDERKLSVCPSVKRVHCDRADERSVQIFYTTRKII